MNVLNQIRAWCWRLRWFLGIAGAVALLAMAAWLRQLPFTSEPILYSYLQIVGSLLCFTYAANALVRFSGTANDINNKGQVVGISCDVNFNCRAFLWEKSVMTDLNTLVAPGSSLYLTFGGGINDFGEIAGTAFDQNTGESPAFLAIPCDNEHADDEGCQAASQASVGVARPRAVLPENVREQLRRQRGFGRSVRPE